MNLTLLHPRLRDEKELRISKVREQMTLNGLDAILVSAPSNLFYLAGGMFRGYVYIQSKEECIYFLIPPCECEAPDVRIIHKPEQIADMLEEMEITLPLTLGLEMDELTYNETERLKKCFPSSRVMDSTMVLRRARECKTPFEQDLMRVDGLKQANVYSEIKRMYVEGMTDLELQIRIEQKLRQEGCLGYLRASGKRMELNMGSLLAGDNADIPSPYDFSMGGAGADPSLPAGASGAIIPPHSAVMVDMNGGFNGYQTDMTRVWTVGSVSDLAHKAHNCSIRILHKLEETALPGVRIGDLYKIAAEMVDEDNLKDYFMGHNHHVKFIGHGVGIELNEIPVIMERNNDPLKLGMTLAIEPKFVIPGVGAVGIENTYIVTENGLENITVLKEELEEFE